MDEFIEKDWAFVEQWLVRQGLQKIVAVFKGMFSQFSVILHYFVSKSDKVNYILFKQNNH